MSSKFESALKATMNDAISVTENGAAGFATSGKKLLDINFAVSSLRSMSENAIESKFADAFYENPLLAIKWLFMARDIRSGMGERRTFRICFKWLANTRPEIVKKLVKLCAEYGRFDDLFCLIGTPVEAEMVDVIDEQWANDVKNMDAGKPVSLLAKWMKSINTSSKKSVAIARFFCSKLNLSEKQYRKTLAKLRAYLKVIEVKMSAKQWSEIDYEAVPSKANIKYNAAFLRNDETRRRAFLGALEKGVAKINSSANFPCDIVHSYCKNGSFGWRRSRVTKDPALEALWKALPKIKINGSLICCCDGSGSMTSIVDPKSSMTALEVCNALGIYCSEHLTGPFKNKYITFSERPQYVDFTNANSLAEKLNIAFQHDECANTNVEAVMDLMLETSVRNHLKQEDIPDLCIISDMEFDSAVDFGGGYSYCNRWSSNYAATKNALFEKIRQKWEAAGYKFPRIIYWNVNSRTGTIPLQQNENGVVLCSGFSQTQFKMLMSNKTDPYEVLVEALNVERYQPVEDAIKNLI